MSSAAISIRCVGLAATALAVTCSICTVGCQGDALPGPTGGGGGAGSGDEIVSFSRDVQQLLTVKCAGCHSPGGAADLAGIPLTLTDDVSYEMLLEQRSVQDPSFLHVVPGAAESSLLFLKVSSDNPPFGDRMPRFAPPLTAEEVALIRAWIDSGAPDN